MVLYKTPEGQNYTLTKHARRQMGRRRVTRQQLEYVLDNHYRPYRDKRGNDRLERDLADGRSLRIVAARGSNPIKVVTVIILDRS